MFTWICQKCGREVPPSYSECPNCLALQKASAEAPVETAPPPPPAPVAAPIIPAPAPAAVRRQVPDWLKGIAVCVLVAGVLGMLYLWLLPSLQDRRRAAAEAPPTADLTGPVTAVSAPAANDVSGQPLAKHIELTGIRLLEDKQQRVRVQLIAVNHSAADLPEMNLIVKLKAAGRAEPVLEFPFTLSGLGPYESMDVETAAKTKLRAYELPDWQFLKAEFVAEK